MLIYHLNRISCFGQKAVKDFSYCRVKCQRCSLHTVKALHCSVLMLNIYQESNQIVRFQLQTLYTTTTDRFNVLNQCRFFCLFIILLLKNCFCCCYYMRLFSEKEGGNSVLATFDRCVLDYICFAEKIFGKTYADNWQNKPDTLKNLHRFALAFNLF